MSATFSFVSKAGFTHAKMRLLLLILLALPSSARPVLFMDWVASPEPDVERLVTEIFNGFDLDVTHFNPGPRQYVAWVIVGGTSPGEGELGHAGLGNWFFGTMYGPVFAAAAYTDGQTDVDKAEIIAHEAGHLFGLNHSTDDTMYPFITGSLWSPPWNDENRAALMETFNFVYEPEVLAIEIAEPFPLAVLPLLLLRRERV